MCVYCNLVMIPKGHNRSKDPWFELSRGNDTSKRARLQISSEKWAGGCIETINDKIIKKKWIFRERFPFKHDSLSFSIYIFFMRFFIIIVLPYYISHEKY